MVHRSALGRGPFGLSLEPQAIGVPEILNEAYLLVGVAAAVAVAVAVAVGAKINCPPLTPTKGSKSNC